MQHELKILTPHLEAVINGDKMFEIRNNYDRGFQKGDIVILKEFDPKLIKHPIREVKVKITYVTNFNQQPDWVVFGFVKFT